MKPTLTPLRQKIWDLLCQHPQPLTAYQLVDLYEQTWRKPIHAMSVYRCLDYFIAQHRVQKIHSLNSYMLMPSPTLATSDTAQTWPQQTSLSDPHLLICDHCHQVIATELSAALLQQLQQTLESSFQLQLSGIELRGLCHPCRVARELQQQEEQP